MEEKLRAAEEAATEYVIARVDAYLDSSNDERIFQLRRLPPSRPQSFLSAFRWAGSRKTSSRSRSL